MDEEAALRLVREARAAEEIRIGELNSQHADLLASLDARVEDMLAIGVIFSGQALQLKRSTDERDRTGAVQERYDREYRAADEAS